MAISNCGCKRELVGQGENAGVQFRSERIKDHFEVIGYQCDMGLAARQVDLGGTVRRIAPQEVPGAGRPREACGQSVKADDWNDLVIRCEGPRIQIWVNGLQTVDYTEPDDTLARSGIIGLQIHGGEPAEASYKNIRIKELSK